MDESGNGWASAMGATNEELLKEEEMMEKLWARERFEMKLEDREATTNELHGVESRYDSSKYENPENHYRALIEFDNELNDSNSGLSEELKRGYLRSLSLNSSYVLYSGFRLRFLRAEFFDVSKAVVRFCNCLNFLYELFGEAALLRQLFLTDLTKAERRLLKEGSMQLSPSRDPLGRRAICFLGNAGDGFSPRERDRVGIYLCFQVLAEDETTQRNGLVSLSFASEGIQASMGGENLQKTMKFFKRFYQSCPLRISASHMCFPNAFLYRIVKPIMLMGIGDTGRRFLKVHSGTRMECDYSLNSFGIRPDDIPTTYSGRIKTRQHLRWLKIRTIMDEHIEKQCSKHVNGDYRYFYASDKNTIEPFPHIQCPEINSVLFHKNGVAWEFPGNVKFREFLDEQLPYNTNQLNSRPSLLSNSTVASDAFVISSAEKEAFADRIIRMSCERNFRFLLHDETKHWYNEIQSPVVLRRYVGFAIRGRQRRMSAKRQRKGSEDYNNNNGNAKRGPKAIFTNMDGKAMSCTNCCESLE